MIAKELWDTVAAESDEFPASISQACAKFLELGALESGQSVLDVACGTGSLARDASSRVGPDGRIVAVDASARMIELAQGGNGGLANVQYVAQDAAALDVPEASFDVAFCRLALPLLSNPHQVLSRVLSALKPGGRFAVMGIGAAEHNEFFTVLADVAGPQLQRSLELGDVNRLAHVLEEASFENVKARSIRALITVESPESYWRAVRGLFALPDPSMPASVAQRVRAGSRLSLELVFALGTRRDPNARVEQTIFGMDEMVAAARRKIRELSPYEVKRKLKRQEVVYLDVREPEQRQALLKNSIHVPRGDIELRVPELVPDPETAILVYCERGRYSALASKQLQDLGYENVWSLYGGITAWMDDGMPVQKK